MAQVRKQLLPVDVLTVAVMLLLQLPVELSLTTGNVSLSPELSSVTGNVLLSPELPLMTVDTSFLCHLSCHL